jgi:hypothetical protein
MAASRCNLILSHLTAPTSDVDPTNFLVASITYERSPPSAASASSSQLFMSPTSSAASQEIINVRIGDVTLGVSKPHPSLSHAVPAAYLAGKGQVSDGFGIGS